jgi:dienelactone hydrolase
MGGIVGPAAGALFRGRVEEHLDRRRRENDRSYVASFHHHAASGAHLPLTANQYLTHTRLSGYRGSRLVHLGRPDCRGHIVAVDADDTVAYFEVDAPGKGGECVLVGESDRLVQRDPRKSPIHGACVDVTVSEAGRNRPRHCPFARTRWPIYRNDHPHTHVCIIPAMTRRRKLSLFVGVPAALFTAALYAGFGYVRATALVVQAAGMEGAALSGARLVSGGFDERRLGVPWRGGELNGRMYVPHGAFERAVLLVPGVHAGGIDEPRLVRFAQDLASVGHAVLTAELPDLKRYSLTPQSTDMIEDAALWLAQQPHLAHDGRVGLMGISFAGGLSVVAASRPSIRDRVAFVLSFGGHGDLPRTLRYLCTGVQPDGTTLPPHDYGVAIILLGVAGRLVPAGQVDALRTAILAYLDASHIAVLDQAAGDAAFARARAMTASLPEPARTLMGYVNDRDVGRLGPLLLPHVADLAGDPALSPSRSVPPAAPVYLLHGTNDNVIPAVESVLLARELRDRGVTVHQLATPLITHASVERRVPAAALWDLISFWTALLEE